jgi:hypothetical protein
MFENETRLRWMAWWFRSVFKAPARRHPTKNPRPAGDTHGDSVGSAFLRPLPSFLRCRRLGNRRAVVADAPVVVAPVWSRLARAAVLGVTRLRPVRAKPNDEEEARNIRCELLG